MRIILVVAAMITGLSTAQATEVRLTLACQGTTSIGREETNPQPTSKGIIVDFKARTVQGFGHPGATYNPVKITEVDDVNIVFEGRDPSLTEGIIGSIDRVTGKVFAMTMLTDGSSTNYDLKCSSTRRKF